MTPELWNRIKELYSAAQDRPENERAEFLKHSCGGDEELRIEVQELLDSHEEDDAFLQNSAVAEVASIFEGEATEGMEPGNGLNSLRLEAGSLLNGRYEIGRLLGRGGMGEVYLAVDTRINRNVALKVLHDKLVSVKESLSRFAREAQVVSALNHPHIMTIYEFDKTSDGMLFFVAEYIDGQTLNHLVGTGLVPEIALNIAAQVSSALSAAHEEGIIHRDIKPENIMVRRDGYVKVLDFGLAKLSQTQIKSGSEDTTRASLRTRPGMVMGTVAHMSPEQARGLDVDARTDIWSLGAVIYEMLTGHKPFSGETQADLIVSLLSNDPPPISSYVPSLPGELQTLVSMSLSKDVAERYQTSEEMRAELERIKKRIEFEENVNRSAVFNYHIKKTNHDRSTSQYRPSTTDGEKRRTVGGDGAVTPQAFRLSFGASGVMQQAQAHWIRTLIFALVFGVLVSVATYSIYFATGVDGRIDSIAVLPFENMSGNPDLTIVTDGLSESLIDRLAQLPQLKVISRGSSFKFRGPNVDLHDVALRLGVRTVVTGSMERVDDDLMVRVDVVDALENRHLAGGQYRGTASDLENMRSEIVQTIVEKLKVRLTDVQWQRLAERYTENSESYRYYLSGLAELNGLEGGREKARVDFEKALEIDPEFALANAEIAWIYWANANASGDPGEMMPKAKAAAEKALAADGELAKAHVVRAAVYEYEFDWANAEREYRRAIDLSPNLDFARNNYAFFLSVLDRQGEALAQLEERRTRDPLNQRLFLLQKGIVLVQSRRFDEALQAYQAAQAVDTSRDIPKFALGYAYAGKGDYKQAVAYYKMAIAELGGEEKYSQPLVYLAATYAKMPEKRNEARAILARIEASSDYTSPALLAAVYSAFNDNDKAMELLEQAYIKRDLLLRYIGTGYEYDGLRDDPRFIDLTKRIGIAQ